jgi:hypothetical protein
LAWKGSKIFFEPHLDDPNHVERIQKFFSRMHPKSGGSDPVLRSCRRDTVAKVEIE